MTEPKSEQELVAQRYAKFERIKQAGYEAYPHKYHYTFSPSQIISKYQDCSKETLEAERVEVKTCGRLMALRGHGKAGFSHVSDGEGKLQIYTRLDAVGEKNYDLYNLLDIGDIVGVEGYLFRTKTNELTVHASRIDLLAKSFLPLPEKWHGLTDVEIRYRQRYLDLLVNRSVRDVFVKRCQIVRELRVFFDSQGYIEVETPMMQPLAGGATAKPFKTYHNALDMDLYLRIAPELYLKRLIVGQLERVYEINRNFRNEGISVRHNPEFTMLEFYQSYSDYRDLMNLTEDLIKRLALAVLGTLELEFEGNSISLKNWQRFAVKEAIVHFWPESCSPRPTLTDLEVFSNLQELCRRWNEYAPGHGEETLAVQQYVSRGVLLGALFEVVVERHLIQPVIIYDYPIELSPLSKTKSDDPSLVERFELYIGGMEIANAYSELNDPEEQQRRFEAQMAEREKGDEEAHQMDEDYVRALRYGMPPTAGEGIGIDRLTMLFTNSRSIRDVILFPHMRPEKRDFMRFELYVALRYLKAKRKQTVISVITVISVLGVAAGVTALIVALSISAGFREDLQSKLLRGTAHINVTPVNPTDGIADYPIIARKIKQVAGVRSAMPAIYQNVLLSSGTRQYVVTLKGLATSESPFSSEDFFTVTQGDILELSAAKDEPVHDRLAIGTDLAAKLGTFVGDFINVISAEGALSPFGYVPRQKRFKIAAIFSSGLYEFDSQWGFTSLTSAQRLFGSGNLVSVIECRVSDIYRVRSISQEIERILGKGFVTLDWQELNRPIFEALKLEKLVMIVTIGLIVFVAALNIITTLVMMVMEKNRDIAVLMSMGATQRNIRKIFMVQGLIIGVVGAILGLVSGTLICWICDTYRLVHLQPDVYSISYVPFKTSLVDGIGVALAAVLISFLATIYPSKSAAGLDPAVALRYE